MTKQKKANIRGHAEQTRIIERALEGYTIPKHIELSKGDQRALKPILDELPISEWSEHKLEIACLLAKTIVKAFELNKILEVEGFVLDNGENSRKYAHPAAGLLKQCNMDIMSYRRSLCIHERVLSGEPRDLGKRREKAKAIEAGAGISNDGLISYPH